MTLQEKEQQDQKRFAAVNQGIGCSGMFIMALMFPVILFVMAALVWATLKLGWTIMQLGS